MSLIPNSVHGTVERHLGKKNAGIFNMWVRPFPVKADRTGSKSYFMVLEDDVKVSPFFYLWTKRVLLSYGEHQDGNLYGFFTIQRSHSIMGVKKGAIWGEHFHDKSVNKSSLFYRYQLLSTWGQVFFPRHWNAFVEWALKARNDTKSNLFLVFHTWSAMIGTSRDQINLVDLV